ncbi:protease AXL1 [Metschnikowia aff. pulcherrima]|uniref:Protease AXL1 n=1 Tax=Metschnikowia aff. pulcherrima TaxID=2163413 RepID=A0A4P6XJZ1_9ASCO|nr:protease AXL1 [Metschnikowia aff. pulcherrima]
MSSSIFNYRTTDPCLELPDSRAHRDYEIVVFPTGLRCLLISDSSSHNVAASMTVGSGSFDDPLEINGLAHLCEHLVVLGGPQTRLRQVVTNSGGSMNAYTGSDQTSFAFEISSHAKEDKHEDLFILDSLLPILASYAQKMKFVPACINNEIKSVHEEHLLNTSNMDKILWHGLRLLALDQHPFSRFATGNSATLSKVSAKTLISELSYYHASQFVHENMAVVIKGPQSVNHLRKVALNSFFKDASSEENANSGSKRTVSKKGAIFDFSQENLLVIKDGDTQRIRICFPMFSEHEAVPTSTQTLLCNLIGNESVDSLCYHLLKTTQYAENVFVHTQEICRDHHLLFIDIGTTKQGMKRVLTVIQMVFHFLENVLLEMPDSELDSIIDEYSLVEQVQFKNRKIPTSLLDEIVSCSEYLQSHKHSLAHIFKNGNFHEIGNSPEIKKTVERYMCRERALIQIVDASFTNLHQFSKINPDIVKDPYFGFEYAKLCYDFSKLPEQPALQPKICHPLGTLRTVAYSLLESRPQQMTTKYRHLKLAESPPQLWCSEDNIQVWTHAQGEGAEVTAHICFKGVSADAENLVGIEILASIVGKKLQFSLYNLVSLGCSWGLYVNVNGAPSIMVSASGPEVLACNVLKMIMNELVTCLESIADCSYQDIKQARVLLRRTYEEYANSGGVKLVFVMASMLFDEGLISPADRIKALELIDTDRVTLLATQMLASHCFTSVFVSGNVSENTLLNVREHCTWTSCHGPINTPNHPISGYVLPAGKSYELAIKGPPGDALAVVYYYIQMGERSDLKTYAMAKLAESVLSALAFDELRMKRNLGYGIFTGMRMFKKTFGLQITIPTGQHSCEYVVEQIEEFLVILEKSVTRISDLEFLKLKQNLLDTVDEPAGDDAASNMFANLQPVHGSDGYGDDETHKLHWNNMEQVLNNTYNFGGKACEERLDTVFLKNLSLKDFGRFFHMRICSRSLLRSVLVMCKKAEEMPRNQKVQILAKILLERLHESGLILPEESLVKELEMCRDLDTLKDLSLERHFTGLGQAMKYKAFKLKLKVGGVLQKFAARLAQPKYNYGAVRETFYAIEDIQRKCHLVE